jgi:cell division protein YceG involved in septum cleavage
LNFWDYLLIVCGISLLALIIWLLTKIPKKEITKLTVKKPEIIIPAWETALKSLDSLKSAQLMQSGKFLEYYFELSSILRRFIEGYYKFNAAEMTTYEINDELSKLEVEERPEIKNYLLNCDMKKYAKQIPTMEDADNSFNWLFKYVSEIKEHELKKAEVAAAEEKKNV